MSFFIFLTIFSKYKRFSRVLTLVLYIISLSHCRHFDLLLKKNQLWLLHINNSCSSFRISSLALVLYKRAHRNGFLRYVKIGICELSYICEYPAKTNNIHLQTVLLSCIHFSSSNLTLHVLRRDILLNNNEWYTTLSYNIVFLFINSSESANVSINSRSVISRKDSLTHKDRQRQYSQA